jgi:4-amino-4-deoxy-L-arabinose transferase-like glycosyltransferase
VINDVRASRLAEILSTIALVVIFAVAAVRYFAHVPEHPPGFYIDESSIAYNAYTISQTGRDEYGAKWPLFFRAFGEYKNPTFVYFLAAVFRVTGPGIAVARFLAASLGLVSSLLLGFLAWRMTERFVVATMVALTTLLTPWLFESSRLVFEVAAYPALLGLFLMALWRASRRNKWGWTDAIALASTLALLTYSYSIGRLLVPLLAAGLALFITRNRWGGVLRVWGLYGAALIPLALFHWRNQGALTGRFKLLTYLTPEQSLWLDLRTFLRQFFVNLNPWRWLFSGESNVRDHLSGTGCLLVGSVFLALFGLILVIRNHRDDAWWRFLLYALLVSLVPASLTRNDFPQLRLIAFPVLFLVLTVPAIAWLCHSAGQGSKWRRVGLGATIGLIAVQGFYFQTLYHRNAPSLWYVFDARFPRKALAAAVAEQKSPTYLVDERGKSGYIHALWYGALQGLDKSRFVRLTTGTPPPGALVISTAEECENCRLIARSLNYIVYGVLPYEPAPANPTEPLHEFRALITAENAPQVVQTGKEFRFNVIVHNVSSVEWPGVAVEVEARWLKSEAAILTGKENHKRLPFDLEPGDTAGVSLEITSPTESGDYVLEVDMVQQGIGWFGSKGSRPLHLSVCVE